MAGIETSHFEIHKADAVQYGEALCAYECGDMGPCQSILLTGFLLWFCGLLALFW